MGSGRGTQNGKGSVTWSLVSPGFVKESRQIADILRGSLFILKNGTCLTGLGGWHERLSNNNYFGLVLLRTYYVSGSSGHFTETKSFHSHSNPMKLGAFLFLIFQGRKLRPIAGG